MSDAETCRQEALARYYVDAVQIVSRAGFCTPHLIMTRLGMGFLLAIVVIEEMQKAGVVGEFDETDRHFPLLEPRGFY